MYCHLNVVLLPTSKVCSNSHLYSINTNYDIDCDFEDWMLCQLVPDTSHKNIYFRNSYFCTLPILANFVYWVGFGPI